ncbi:MAG: protein kinase [Acidobacteria bacterium]|nr:protein kinase [Acidobacteriota bacterium]
MSRYRIVESLGRGGMGEVCLADDLVLHRQVALKFLMSPGEQSEQDALDQLLGEARAAAALDHPFICSIYEVATLDGRPCIVMEYVRGETLERRLRRGPMPLADALHVAEEVAEALEAAHKRRVIHRDLKPANVMLTEDQHVKVMDFGLATRLPVESLEPAAAGRAMPAEVGVVRGTPAYMAPEQIRGEPADRRSDIFACGIVLYELLSGSNPFHRGSVDETLAAILGEPAADLRERTAGVPAPVAALVARLLAKDPAARPASFGDIRMSLRRVAVDPTPAAAHPVAPIVPDLPHAEASARLIGRDAERAQLLDRVRQAAAGRGGVVVLEGDAGVGKTRLAEETLRAARQIGCVTLVGRCDEQESAPALLAYIELLEDASRVLPAASFRRVVAPGAPELAMLLPELHRLFPDLAAPLDLPPQLRQRFLFKNVEELFVRCSRIAPLILFVDDLQWADEPTVQLTQHLAGRLAGHAILLVTACRESEDPPAGEAKGALQHLLDRVRGQGRDASAAQTVRAVIADIVRQGAARRIGLQPFAEVDVRGMLAAFAHDDPPARLVRRFVEQTGGNPFFVAELYRHLKEDGRLFNAQGRWRRDLEIDEADIPESVRSLLERRLARVPADTQKVLRAAAIIGRQFDLDLLEAVADADADAVVRALEEAEQARLLKGPSGRHDILWRFPHQLVCQTLAASTPQLRRQRLHLRIADAMTRLDPASERYAAEIAHHLYSAGRQADAGRTARALVAAGDAAYMMYATDEATGHYRRALEVLRDGDGTAPIRRGVEERLADLLALVGDRWAALEAYQRILEESVHAERVDHARMSRKIGTLHWQGGDRTAAMTWYRRALETLDGSAAHLESAHLYHELGRAAFRSGDSAQAIQWAEQALQAAEAALADLAAGPDVRRTATAAIAHATNTIGVALARSGNLDGARQRIERSVAAARELGLLDVACRGYANLGVLYSTVEPQRAIEVSLTGLDLASKIGAASLQPYIYANLAAAYCALTDRCEKEGLEAAQAAATIDRELGQLDHLAVPLIVIAQIHQCRGELQRAQDAYREALALAERIGEPQLLLPCYDGLATVSLDRGDRERAAEYMERARQLCVRTGLDPDTLLLLPFLC